MTSAPDTPDDLTAELKDRVRWLCTIFGQPSELLRVFEIAHWRRLRTWVCGVEALASQLVRALAATIETPVVASRPSPTLRIEKSDPDTDYPDSAHWVGVRFRLKDDGTAPSPAAAATASVKPLATPKPSGEGEQPGFRSARRLALRLEAVIRVAENPDRYARRFARRKAKGKPRTRNAQKRRSAQPPAMLGPRIVAPGSPLPPPAIDTG